MIDLTRVTISMMLGQVPVELEIMADAEGIALNEIKTMVDFAIEQGFTPPARWSDRNADSILNKKGTVKSVTPLEGTKMFEVLGILDDGGNEFKWKVFSATTFRRMDRFEVIKNDRGFREGKLIDDDGEGQRILPL